MENIRINKVQKAAFELIQSDARFLNTIIDINTCLLYTSDAADE